MTSTNRSSLAPEIWDHNRDILDQIIQCVEEGTYCALLGPRFYGKSAILRHVQSWMEAGSLACIHIDLFETQASTQVGFFTSLAEQIAESIAGQTKRPIRAPYEEMSSAVFRDFLARCVDHLGTNLTVIFDHLEGLPTDLNRALLTSLRALHMEQQDRELRFIAIVSGALSLAALTVGETSPFHGIARRLFVGDLSEEESSALVHAHTASIDIQVSPSARSLLLEATRGNPHLIKHICRRSLALAAEYPSRQVTVQTVNRVIREFLIIDAPTYGPLQEAIRLVEDDPDLLQCILKLLNSPSVQLRELPLPLFPDLDPLYLTGLVEKVGQDSYRIHNGIYHQYLRHHFDAARAGYLFTVSGRWDAAIGHLEASIVSGNEQSRADLMAATINSMYASETEEQAAYYLIRGLSAAFQVDQIAVWLITRDSRHLTLLDQKGTTYDGVLPTAVYEIPTNADRIEARSFRQVCILREHQDESCTRYVVPLMAPGNTALGVVSLCDSLEPVSPTDQRNREFQFQRYLNQAARALFEVEFRRRREARSREQDAQLEKQTNQLFLLHRISTLSQTIYDTEKVSHLNLTAITSHFGLGFNRAWLFLNERNTDRLVGRMGIGSFTEEQAYQAWGRFASLSFDDYVQRLMNDQIEHNEIDSATRALSFSVSESSDDLFSMAVHQKHSFNWSGAPEHWHELPQEFRQIFDPGEMILTPLVVHNNCLGLIAVDNKFSSRVYTDADELLLKSFANQMATALFNIQQHEQEMQRLQLEETLRDTSLIIGSSLELKEVLHRILDEMRKVLPFDTASIQLANEVSNKLEIIAATGFEDVDHVETLDFSLDENYPNVLVYKNKEPFHLSDVQEHYKHFADPHYGATHVHGWLGAPLIINDQVIGVITLDSETPGIYTYEHDRMAVLFGGQASVAIQNARLFENEKKTKEYLEKVEQNLRMILDTVGIMSKVNDSDAGLTALAKKIVDAKPVTFCSILLLDESRQNLVVKVAYPNPRPLSSTIRWNPAMGERISLAQDNQMKRLVDLPEHQVYRKDQPYQGMDIIQHLQQYVLLDEEIQSILVVPLKAGSEILGICILGESRSWSRSPFDDDKIKLVSSMVTQGAVFVDRLQAHEITKNKLIMVERLRSIGEDLVMASPGPATKILDKVVKAARDVMGARSAVIYPWVKNMRTYETNRIIHIGLRRKKYFSDKIRDEESSMTGLVLRKKMIIVDDIQHGVDRTGETKIWRRPGKFLEDEDVKAFVGVSLRRGEEALGVLFVNFPEPHYFSNSELEAIILFANQAVIAIENARLYEDLHRRLEESLALQRVGISLAETRDLDLVLDKVMQAALELIHADSGNILFFDQNTDEFREDALMSAGKGLPLEIYKTRVRQQSGYSYEIIKNRKPVRINDTVLDSKINPVSLKKGRRAVLGVPLIGRENSLGVLWVNWKSPREISERDEKFLMALAGQAAVAIENVKLFEELKAENIRRNEESQALQAVGISLTEPIELKEVLYRVLQAALELVDGDEDTILFYDEGRDEFDTEALTCTALGGPLKTYQTQVRQRSGLAYQIVRGRKPVSIPDALLDTRISPVAIEKGRRATVGVPLLDSDGPVGVLWVNWKQRRQLSTRDESLLTALASQATVAIKGAKRYAEIQRRSAHLEAVHEAGKVISAASVGLDRQQVLDRILEQAIECVTGVSHSKASVGTIQLFDEETGELVVKSVFPRQYPQRSIDTFDHISLDAKKSRQGRIGITGRALVTRKSQRVPDVTKDEDYILHSENTKSELAIPMVDNDTVIGVMDLESEELNAFDELDETSLGLLVDLASVALRNAERAEELARSNTVALMGAWGAEIAHDVNREVGYILRDTFLLQERPDLPAEVKVRLKAIEQSAENLALPQKETETESWLPSQISCNLAETISSAVHRYQNSHPAIGWLFEQDSADVVVAIHKRRLFSILRHLLRNAAHALQQGKHEPRVSVRTSVAGQMAMIEVEDNGPGVPLAIRSTLFRETIPHEDGRKGSGLLLIRFISEQYGGRVELVEQQKDQGACFRVWLPIVSAANQA